VENCIRTQSEEATLLMRDMAATLRRGWNCRRTA
jgi:hypothetical protein